MPLGQTDTERISALKLLPPALAQGLVPEGPHLSGASGELLRRIRIVDEYGDEHGIEVPVERPLSIRLDERIVATLWTLGGGPEWLVMGYLWTHRLVRDVTSIESISIDFGLGVAAVRSRGMQAERVAGPMGTEPGGALLVREALQLAPLAPRRVARSTVLAILEYPLQDDAVYRRAGSVHGCALFRDAQLWLRVEDVSRRNALDTICGWMALHGISGADKILYCTGRLTAEVIFKAAFSGIGTIISRKGVTASCCDLAGRLGMTLFGHAARGRFSCYAGIERFDPQG